jgi:hypothetical protein
LGKVLVVTVRALFTTSLNVPETVWTDVQESWTEMLGVKVPATVGVPEATPLDELILIPVGKLEPEKVSGGMPPRVRN